MIYAGVRLKIVISCKCTSRNTLNSKGRITTAMAKMG